MLQAVIYLTIGTLFMASLTTPLFYEAIDMVLGESPWPFSRVYDRVAMLWIVLFLLLLRKSFDLRTLFTYVKGQCRKSQVPWLALGLILSFLGSMLLLPQYVEGSVFVWKDITYEKLFFRSLNVLPAALVISVIEEVFFRVVFFEKCRQHMPFLFAVIVTSMFYALVHFITPVKSWTYPGYSLFVGFEYLGAVAERIMAPGVLPAAFGLFLVGVVLCVVIYRTRSLLACIGLHSGWVLAVKIAAYMTVPNEGHTFTAGAGRRYFLVSEPYSWLLVIGVGVLYLSLYSLFSARISDDPNSTGEVK